MIDRPADTPLIEARGLVKEFMTRRRLFDRAPAAVVRAVDNVSLSLVRRRTLGLVGESGCGKSTLARLLIRLVEPTAGRILFDGVDITRLDAAALRPIRQRLQMVFQDPMGSLDPRLRIADSIAEPLLVAGRGDAAERRRRADELIALVGLAPDHASRYPHEFSGGQRQRICIARALALNPDLIIADEPVSALDVSIRAQIINLLQDVQERFSVAYLFISHDLNVVRHVASEVAVMYLGEIVEHGPAQDVIDRPAHPYAKGLRAATPVPRIRAAVGRTLVEGDLPSPAAVGAGCRFRSRCREATARCAVERPLLRPLGNGRLAACHNV